MFKFYSEFFWRLIILFRKYSRLAVWAVLPVYIVRQKTFKRKISCILFLQSSVKIFVTQYIQYYIHLNFIFLTESSNFLFKDIRVAIVLLFLVMLLY